MAIALGSTQAVLLSEAVLNPAWFMSSSESQGLSAPPLASGATAAVKAVLDRSVIDLGKQHPGKPVTVVRKPDRVGCKAELTVRGMVGLACQDAACPAGSSSGSILTGGRN